tara:strand:+ start:853 stop:2052 length:1200 start_codon:yes stop_codon:yes gene_type:complete
MACNIGANDVANAMGTSVGSKTLNYKQAVMIAAVAEFAGAFLVGGHVSDTVRKGMLDPMAFSGMPLYMVYGMIAALVASSIWLNLASYLGWPVSTTHAIIGGVTGFGIAFGGMDIINWPKMGNVVLSWLVSPLLGGFFSFVMFRFIQNRIFKNRNPVAQAKIIVPWLVFLVIFILVNAIIYKGLKNLSLDMPFSKAAVIACFLAILLGWISRILVRKIIVPQNAKIAEQYQLTENVFKYLQTITAFYVAFAHGANDVANAVGPLAAVSSILSTGEVSMKVEMPLWILAMGGTFIVVGLLIWGVKVMQTVGQKITEITPSRGFSAEFGAATVVLICSKLGLPISTTHTLVGSVIGVGLARGLAQLNLRIIKTIIISWFATVPFTMILSMILFKSIVFFIG